MDMPFNRRDIGFTVISRFEESFRWFLVDKMPPACNDFLDQVPGGIIDKAKVRTEQVSWEEPYNFLEDVDFPDLTEIVCYQNMYSALFPGVELPQREFRTCMSELYDLRCKIAHVKGYFTSLDLDRLAENARRVAGQLGDLGDSFIMMLRQLEENPAKVVMRMPLEFCIIDDPKTLIPSNVPTPDYEYEGGFVGREEDIRKIVSLLEGNLHRVVTIAGAGGVGKSALALRVLHQIERSPGRPFDGIVWMSAKESRLSYLGIEDVEGV